MDYSLAPENPFPRALEECFYVYAWALKNSEQLGMKFFLSPPPTSPKLHFDYSCLVPIFSWSCFWYNPWLFCYFIIFNLIRHILLITSVYKAAYSVWKFCNFFSFNDPVIYSEWINKKVKVKEWCVKSIKYQVNNNMYYVIYDVNR